MKYMRALGVSIHTAASLVIGRRGLRFKEKVPALYRNIIPEKNLLRHHWSHWRFLHRHLKQFKVHTFYKVPLTGTPFDSMKACKSAVA
ncbi:MAG: hypothetical protein FH756_19830 [Firmicutes bacterium]|nr:hypothetical protein [Bacillota bacterium]